MRRNLVKRLQRLDAVAIESPLTGIGIPDVEYIGGWLECKWLRTWPKRAETHPVKFSHPLSAAQMVWLARRCRRGGIAMCVVQVSKSWFFFDGIRIKTLWDQMTRPEMIEEAELYFPNGLRSAPLLEFLRQKSRSSAMRNDF